MTFKRICRYDDRNRMFRVCRIVWNVDMVPEGECYSVKMTLAFRPRLFQWHRERDAWFVTVLGMRVHYARSYGGRFA